MSAETQKSWSEIAAWRRARRAELIARRENVPAGERKAWNDRITAHLVGGFEIPEAAIVGFCWPYRGEFDARFAVRRWRESGVAGALPEVVEKNAPLQFRRWWPGVPMRPGVYNIPVPDGTEVVVPDVAIVPMNGFDGSGFRLGYGGAFFDTTLAAHRGRIAAIGVSYEVLRLDTIFPQPHDIPMDFVVTEEAIYAGGGGPLERLDPAASRARFARLLEERRLPREAYREGGYSSPACYASEFPGYFGEERDEKK